MNEQTAENTDKELWRENPGDYYAPSIHVTNEGWIGINVGGKVFVKDVRTWNAMAQDMVNLGQELERITDAALKNQAVYQQEMNDKSEEISSLKSQLEQANKTLELYETAISEAEAIFGGEYADKYGPMFELAMRARDSRAVLKRSRE